MRRRRETTVAVEKQHVLHNLSVCLLPIQHAKRMRSIILLFLVCLVLPHFPHIISKRYDFRKNVKEPKIGVWCDFDCASSLICGNKMPTRCNRGFYCPKHVEQAIRSVIKKTSVASSWHFISTYKISVLIFFYKFYLKNFSF